MRNEDLKILIDNNKKGQLSHAILFETNDVYQCYKDVVILARYVFWEEEPLEINNYLNLIKQNIFIDLNVIEPVKGLIKKEEVLKLISGFSVKPEYSSNKIYIIKEVEKMNESAVNSILKFLEEPQQNIYGFLITTNKELVIPTVRSRCQYIKMIYEEDFYKKNDISEKFYESFLNHVEKIVELISKKELEKLFIYKATIIADVDKDRENLIKFFRILKNYYYIALNESKKTSVEKDMIINLIRKDSAKAIIEKIKIIENNINNCYFNVNIDLAIDKLFIEMVR